MIKRYVDLLSSKNPHVRLSALKKIKRFDSKNSDLFATRKRESVNCQIHTVYSFSPYTPSLAAYTAYKFGLSVAGIMDNYTLEGVKEFVKACKILGITYSVGVEFTAEFGENDLKYSNLAVCGIAMRHVKDLQAKLKNYRDNQKENVISTLEAVNKKIKKYDLEIDFKKDVLPLLARSRDKVCISKHVYFALAKKLVQKFGQGEKIAELLTEAFSIELSDVEKSLLANVYNPYYVYDLTGIISENYFVFHAKKQYPRAEEIVKLGHSVGGVATFEFVPDKKYFALSVEEQIAYNAVLVEELNKLDFDAVAFNPTKFAPQVRDELLKVLADKKMLPLNRTKVDFPRRKFDATFPTEELRSLMNNSVYAIVGSEMCENDSIDTSGLVNASELNFDEFEKKVAFYATVGRKEF